MKKILLLTVMLMGLTSSTKTLAQQSRTHLTGANVNELTTNVYEINVGHVGLALNLDRNIYTNGARISIQINCDFCPRTNRQISNVQLTNSALQASNFRYTIPEAGLSEQNYFIFISTTEFNPRSSETIRYSVTRPFTGGGLLLSTAEREALANAIRETTISGPDMFFSTDTNAYELKQGSYSYIHIDPRQFDNNESITIKLTEDCRARGCQKGVKWNITIPVSRLVEDNDRFLLPTQTLPEDGIFTISVRYNGNTVGSPIDINVNHPISYDRLRRP